MTVITRFAPSPTGFLHIGGVRTALFNYLFARHHKGKYLLRIEDTDKSRSTKDAKTAILDGLDWMGLAPDDTVVYQSQNYERHVQVAHTLVTQGKAYYCYTTPEELQTEREKAQQNNVHFSYDRRWRDTDTPPPANVTPVIRLKCPLDGTTVIDDLVQGRVSIENKQLDDYILLRSDGTPTYMLSVVVDDIDMNITHIIRGDDHLNNAFRQVQLFNALGKTHPHFAHIPLIHGCDGKKLSKRHGALGIEQYKHMGYLPEALKNYLCRLGWAYGDAEIFTQEQAISWFSTDGIGKSPSRMDFEKMENLNAHYIREMDTRHLLPLVLKHLGNVPQLAINRITKGLHSIKSRATTMNDFQALCAFYISAPTFPLADAKMQKMIKDDSPHILAGIVETLSPIQNWQESELENAVQNHITEHSLTFGMVGPPMRATLAGTVKSPNIFEIMEILGKAESLKRLQALNTP